MGLENLARTAGAWLKDSGPESDIVISSRVRLARNLKDHPFLPKAAKEDRAAVAAKLREAILKAGWEDALFVDMEEISSTERMLLVERRLISKELAGGEGERGVAFGPEETHSLMVNEEDHLY